MLIPALMAASSFLGGLSKRKALQESSKSELDSAIATKVRGYFEQRGMKLDQESLLSTIRNRAAGMGLDITQGSPLEAYLQASRETQLDILHVKNTAEAEVEAHKKRARQLATAAEDSLFGSLLSGGADIMKYQTLKNSVKFKG